MPFSEIMQLHMPSLFPLVAFEDFVKKSRSVIIPASEARHEFGRASNIIGWRFRACVENKEDYMSSWRRYRSDISFDENYNREKLFFFIFVSGVSCIEATVYACYALASDTNVFGFPFDESIRRNRSGPKCLKEKLQERDPTIALVSVLDKLITSDQWKFWKDFRNAMTHRSNIPRIIHASIGGPLPREIPLEFAPTWSTRALSGDEGAFNEMISWLAASLEQLFIGGIQLADKK
jgi:hypothetical protein